MNHLDNEKKTVATTSWVTLSNWYQGIFYMYYPKDRIVDTMTFVTPDVTPNIFTTEQHSCRNADIITITPDIY